jgi:protein phosphatase
MRSAALSDAGPARSRNEDAYWCDADRGIFVVADGTGANQGGEVAAATAIDVISTELTLAVDRGLQELDLADALFNAFREASGDIFGRAQENQELQEMSCSAVAAVVTAKECVIAHAGDVRAYLYCEDGLHQITVDDTPVAVMVKRGYLLPEKARTHHLKNVLVKSIGTQSEVEANLIRMPIKPRERLLFCSDGLWGSLADEEINQILQRNLDPEATCYELAHAARSNGSQDDITIVLVEADRPVDRIALLAGKSRSV